MQEGPWFADDPVAPGGASAVVSPVLSGEVLSQGFVADDPGLAQFCAERWLAAWPRLEPLPPGFAGTRASLHRVAERVMKPARERANGKFGLRYTRAGFGTPFYGADEQLRVEGTELVHSRGDDERRAPLTTLRAAAELAGVPGEGDETSLAVDAAASVALGRWYGFCCSVLEELRVGATDPSRVQLWPEHFDLALKAARAVGRPSGVRRLPGRRGARGALSLRGALERAYRWRALERHRLSGRRAHLRRAACRGRPARAGARLLPQPTGRLANLRS